MRFKASLITEILSVIQRFQKVTSAGEDSNLTRDHMHHTRRLHNEGDEGPPLIVAAPAPVPPPYLPSTSGVQPRVYPTSKEMVDFNKALDIVHQGFNKGLTSSPRTTTSSPLFPDIHNLSQYSLPSFSGLSVDSTLLRPSPATIQGSSSCSPATVIPANPPPPPPH